MLAFVGALTLVGAGTSGDVRTYQEWLARSRMPAPRVSVQLRLAPCPGRPRAFGCAGPPSLDGLPPRIWLHPRAPSPRRTLLHEVGHVFDFYMSRRDRARFQRLMRDRRPWTEARETFAEAYATCARRPRLRGAYFGRHGYAVSARTHGRVCHLIARGTTLTSRSRRPAAS